MTRNAHMRWLHTLVDLRAVSDQENLGQCARPETQGTLAVNDIPELIDGKGKRHQKSSMAFLDRPSAMPVPPCEHMD